MSSAFIVNRCYPGQPPNTARGTCEIPIGILEAPSHLVALRSITLADRGGLYTVDTRDYPSVAKAQAACPGALPGTAAEIVKRGL